MKHPRSFRRLLLGTLAAAFLAAPALSTSGCSPGDIPSNQIRGLRVLAAQASDPYAAPGQEVTFQMSLQDGLDPENVRPVQILWLGGCYNPPGDLYYGCFPQLAQLFQSLPQNGSGGLPEGLPIGFGPTFVAKIPDDIITSRPPREDGQPRYGVYYVFFAACAGQIRPVELDPGGQSGFFPFACFDEEGNRLPSDSFVPGYTQIFSFEDGRTNANPTVTNMLLDGEPMSEDVAALATVKACPSTQDERRAVGCAAGDAYEGCQIHELDVEVPTDVAEIDPGELVGGEQIHEAVWVNFLADGGDFTEGALQLVSGVTEGYKEKHSVQWAAPNEPGLYTIWAVVRDGRGGATPLRRFIRVE
jgi:hypothetical protein